MGLSHMNCMHIARVASDSTIIEVPAWMYIFSSDLDRHVGGISPGLATTLIWYEPVQDPLSYKGTSL
jgi:hypothetical protein